MSTQQNIMGRKKMLPLLLSMSLPPMISMLIQALYNIVDSMFVARISQNALTAVSLVFPLQNIVLSIAVGFGIGICACIAKSLGAKNGKEADSAVAHGFIYSIVHSVLLIGAGLLFTRPFLQLFTADPEILQMGTEYGYWVMLFSFATVFHCYIEKSFQAVGNMIAPMLVQGIGAIINIILDPILIFGWLGFPAMGVRGAAIATIIGQLVACSIAVVLFLRNKNGLHLSLKKFRPNWRLTKQLYAVAIPSTIMMVLPSILVTTLNKLLVAVSATAVNVLGIYMKLQSFVYMPASGIIQGMRPIVSFNYGANNTGRMRQAMQCSLCVIGAIMLTGTVLFLVFPTQILSLFNADAAMLDIGQPALRIISLGFLFSTVGIVLAGTFEALGKGVHSLMISLTRQFILVLPLSWLLIGKVGLLGVWLTFPLSELVAAILAGVLYVIYIRRKLLKPAITAATNQDHASLPEPGPSVSLADDGNN